MKCAVYRHYDAVGALLYVGCSLNPMVRSGAHKRQAPWIDQVAWIRIDWFDTQELAQVEEARLINDLSPPHNTRNRNTWAPWQEPSGPKSTRKPASKQFEDLFSIFGGIAGVARAVDVPYQTAAGWYRRASIPAKYDLKIIEAARPLGHHLTLADLTAARCPA